MPYIKKEDYRKMTKDGYLFPEVARFHELYMFHLTRFVDGRWKMGGEVMTLAVAQEEAAREAKRCIDIQRKAGY